jgi:hypothetical protein
VPADVGRPKIGPEYGQLAALDSQHSPRLAAVLRTLQKDSLTHVEDVTGLAWGILVRRAGHRSIKV